MSYPAAADRRLRPESDDEIVPEDDAYGSDTDTDDEAARYYLDYRPAAKRRCLEEILAGSRSVTTSPAPTPSCGSDATISDGAASAASASAAAPLFPCPVCPREFTTKKGVHGHMRVHALAQEKERPVPESTATAVAPAEPEPSAVLDPMPLAVAAQSDLSEEKIVRGGSSSGAEPDRGEPKDVAAHAPQQIAAHHQPAAQPPAHAAGFRCKEPGCGKWFHTHQGLGGHVAGHKNKAREAKAAAAGQGGDAGAVDAAPVKVRACNKCGQVFPTGVALGGHMRKHYKGNKQPVGKQVAGLLRLGRDELAPALALALALAPARALPGPGMEAPQLAPALLEAEPEPSAEVAQPEQAPAVPGVVRIFGFDVRQAPQDSSQDSTKTV